VTTAAFFADNMVKIGVPARLRDLAAAAYDAADAEDYAVDLTTTTPTGEPCEASVVRHNQDHLGNASPGTIHICAEAGGDAIWDLLHELGHALHGHAPGKEKTSAHEAAMWERGWKWANAQSPGTLTQGDEAAFRARAAACLRTYCPSPPTLNL